MTFGPLLDHHLTDDQLMESYVLALDHRHMNGCRQCQTRYDDLSQALEQARDTAIRESDLVFTPERLDEQRSHILRRLERLGHPGELVQFPLRSGGRQAAQRLLGPARRWVVSAAAAGLVAGLLLGFAVDRKVTSSAAAQLAPAASAPQWQPAQAGPQDEQMLSEIEDALTGTRRVLELGAIDAMTTPPEVQEASFVPR